MEKIVKELLTFALFCGITFGISFLGQATLMEHMAWYNGLQKASFNPPAWAFSLVWPVLYFLMASAAWMVWRKKGFFCKELYWYYAQLIVNALYMPIFFGLQLLIPSMLWIVLLIALIVKTMQLFFKADRLAGKLFVPYLAWCCFALILSTSLVVLN